MGSLKALTLAGAVAMLAVPTALVPAARAADLLPPPPPLPAPVAEDSGFYLRGDVGVGINNGYGLSSTFATGATLAGLGAWDGPVNIGDSGVFDIGVGYQFNSWFRADMTLGYISNASYNSKVFYQYTGLGSNCPTGGGSVCGDNYNAGVRNALFLANGYFDIGTWMGVTPYIGGGIGFASYSVSGLTDVSMSQPNAYGVASNYSGTNFAWDVTTGLLFHITPNLLIDMSYRYVDMGKLNTGAIACNGGPSSGCNYESQHFTMVSNALTLGMLWMLTAPYVPPVVAAKY
jgi:opacity protein-like surface antigen